jgi:DNA-directed RNA polymerase subunit M/transcription elongation factor TFIIS
MPSTETLRAHCGACAGRMIMRQSTDSVWFVCQECGETTDPRPTAAEADDDVVWASIKQTRQQDHLARN